MNRSRHVVVKNEKRSTVSSATILQNIGTDVDFFYFFILFFFFWPFMALLLIEQLKSVTG